MAISRRFSTLIALLATAPNWKFEKAAEELKFEKAALLRDQIKELKRMIDGTKSEAKPVSYKKFKGDKEVNQAKKKTSGYIDTLKNVFYAALWR